MKVYGVEIDEEIIKKVKSEFVAYPSSFTMTSLDMAIQSLGIPMYIGDGSAYVKCVSHRAADRLLQKWKKEGLIEYKYGKWHVISRG